MYVAAQIFELGSGWQTTSDPHPPTPVGRPIFGGAPVGKGADVALVIALATALGGALGVAVAVALGDSLGVSLGVSLGGSTGVVTAALADAVGTTSGRGLSFVQPTSPIAIAKRRRYPAWSIAAMVPAWSVADHYS